MKKFKYILDNWKLGVHLVLHTRRFGVNNKWWCPWVSWYGYSLLSIAWNLLRVYPVINSYRYVKSRCIHLGFLNSATCRLLWGTTMEDF